MAGLQPDMASAPSVGQLTFLQPPARAQGGNHAVQLLISAGGDGRLRCWNVLAMRLLFVLPLTPPIARDPLQRPPRPAAGLGVGRDAITALRWERRLGMLLAGDAAGRVAVWDCSSLVRLLASAAAAPLKDDEVYARLVPLRRWRAHASAVVSIEIVPPSSQFDDAPPSETEGEDGEAVSELLVTASRDSDLRMWSYRDPRPGTTEPGFAHVGRFGRDSWSLDDASSHCKPPRVATQALPQLGLGKPYP